MTMNRSCRTCREDVEVTAQEIVMGDRYGDMETESELAAIRTQADSIWDDPELLETVPSTCQH
jgi:hypothetical protein